VKIAFELAIAAEIQPKKPSHTLPTHFGKQAAEQTAAANHEPAALRHRSYTAAGQAAAHTTHQDSKAAAASAVSEPRVHRCWTANLPNPVEAVVLVLAAFFASNSGRCSREWQR